MPRRRLHALRRLVGVLYFDGFDDVADTKLGDDVFAFDGLAEHGIAGIEVMLGAETQVDESPRNRDSWNVPWRAHRLRGNYWDSWCIPA